VRGIIEQIARGLQAMHRMEMVHQDLRPENLLIDRAGTVKIIDFASTQIAGLVENAAPGDSAGVLGTVQYAAPEYFVGDGGSAASDQFSLGVIAYQMLSGRLPYGAQVARIRTRAEQQRLAYRSVIDPQREIPAWVDGALRKAVHPNPLKRYEALSEFVHDLRHPNRAFLNEARPALMQRDPLLFWKGLALLLAVAVAILLGVLRSIA
jgi:serine/threonine protein kinase